LLIAPVSLATLPWEIQKSQQLTVTSQLSRLQRSQVLYWTSSYSITVYHGSAYTVVRVTSYFYGKWQNWGHQNSVTPKPTVTKIGMGDYVGDITHTPKFKVIAPVGASRQMGEISLSCGF